MKIYDVAPLTPPGLTPEDWQPIMAAVHGSQHEYIVNEEQRLSWLHRLVDEAVWGEAIVITDHTAFPFWRLAPPEVVVQDEAGKKLGKTQRTEYIYQWAVGVHIGSTKKSDITAWERSYKHAGLETAEAIDPIMEEYQASKSNGRSLYETDGTYELVTPATFSQIREKILGEIALGNDFCWDTETDQTNEEDSASPNPWSARLVDISIGTAADPKHAYRIPVAHNNAENFSVNDVVTMLNDYYATAALSGSKAVLHNCKYDYSVMCNPIQRFDANYIYAHWLPITIDTMLAAQVANMRPAGLKPLARKYLGVTTIDFKKLTGGKSFALVPEEPANIYAGQDADWPLRLWPIIKQRLEQFGPDTLATYEKRVRVTEFFMRCERRGLKPNVEKLQALHDQTVTARQTALEGLVRSLIDDGVRVPDEFNPGSSQQLARVLFSPRPEGLGLPVLVRTKTGAPSAGAKARNALSIAGVHHPALIWLKAWSKAEQLITAFTTPLLTKFIQADGRVHPSFGVAATETGRTSCQMPNAQQLNTAIASCFEAEVDPETGRKGELADLDYSQIELRVLAVVFDEPKMLETFSQPRYVFNDKGEQVENPDADIHARTQRETGATTRRFAKNLNFGKAFLGGDETLSITTNTPIELVRPFSQAFDKAYEQSRSNIGQAAYEAQQAGLVRTWEGWVRLLPPALSEKQKSENKRLVANTPVQGGANGIIMTAIDNLLPLLRDVERWGIHPFNMIHDALYFEREPRVSDHVWHKFLERVMQVMEAANPWSHIIPMYTDCKVGFNWGDDLHAPEFTDVDEVEALFAADFEPELEEVSA